LALSAAASAARVRLARLSLAQHIDAEVDHPKALAAGVPRVRVASYVPAAGIFVLSVLAIIIALGIFFIVGGPR
jgi:hypothetical protein